MATIRIKSSHPESQGPFVEIDEANFDAETMELYSEEQTVEKGISKMKVDELRAELKRMEVDFPADAKKDELVALLTEATAK